MHDQRENKGIDNIEKLRNLILAFPKGEVITPKKVGMENNKTNFYRWIKNIDEVEKIGKKHIKII